MKKISLTVLGMYFTLLAGFSQNSSTGDSTYRTRKLRIEEANIVSSYYQQDGDNATVTGGLGSQKLNDISTSFDVKFVRYDRANQKHSFLLELGIDHYTSASSDKIDPSTISSASHEDNRFYPSVNWSMENENKGSTVGAGLYYSTEYDYHSFGGSINFSKKSKSANGEFSAKLQAYIDQISAIYPIELRTSSNTNERNKKRNTFSGTFSWSQVINHSLQVMLEGEMVYQQGYLSLPFHRVYFNDNTVHVEKLPISRLKIPIGFRASYFLGDGFIIRAWYRRYYDDWNIKSNTFQLETSIKFNPFYSVTPFYRFYQQTSADYFAPYASHSTIDDYYTSNYDLSKFISHFFGLGFRMAPPNGVFALQHFNTLEVRYGHYRKNINLNSNIISIHVKFN
jgi:hypothetical protein